MKFFKRKLENGITVIFEKRELPLVSVSITNKFGAGYEESKIKGIAHFMEHLVFTGTKTRTHEDISKEIEKKGGILNAFTAHEVTSFWFKLPSEHIFSGLNILVDILNNPKFDLEKFEKEKRVILEEIKMYHDTPMRFVYDMVEANLYKKPFGESVIGSKETVGRLDRDFVAKFFEEVYNPANYIVTLVGDANFDEVCNYLEKSFEAKKEIPKEEPIKLKNSESVEEREGIDQAHFIFAIHSPKMSEKDYYAMEVLDAYLAKGMSSKLFLKIREELGLAYAIKSSINTERNYSYYSIYVGTMKDKVEQVKKIILEEFENVKNISEEDIEEAKEMIIGLKKLASEDSDNVMTELLFSELNGNAEDYYLYEKNVRAVSLEQVKKLANIKKYSSAAIVPK